MAPMGLYFGRICLEFNGPMHIRMRLCCVILRCAPNAKSIPANTYLFKFNNRNTRKRGEIFSKLTIKKPERRQRRRSGVFIANFENISHLFLMLLLLNLSK